MKVEVLLSVYHMLPADRMCPVRSFCAVRHTLWEFSNSKHLPYLVYSPLFKSARLASDQFPLKGMYGPPEMIHLIHDTCRREEDVKAVSTKVQGPPLLLQRHSTALGLLYKSSFGPGSNLTLRPLGYVAL